MTTTGSLERMALLYEEVSEECSRLRVRNAELLAALSQVAEDVRTLDDARAVAFAALATAEKGE